MKILVLADEESKYYWDFFEKKKLEGIELIISCGDLAPQYLSFLATFSHAPILYIHGNHDGCYAETPPEGCICIDGLTYEYNGIKIAGLGGSMQYNFFGSPHQYTEKNQRARLKKLRRKIKKQGGIDIFVTHSPAFGLNDSSDLAHTGFQCYLDVLNEFSPKYFVHGHVHINYGRDFVRESKFENTTVVNAYEKYIIEI